MIRAICAFLVTAQTVCGQVHDPYERGLTLLYEYRPQEALNLFDSLIRKQPDNPTAYSLKASAYWWLIAADSKNKEFINQFLAAVEQAVAVAEKNYDTHPTDPEAKLMLGGAYGYLGRYHAMVGNWLRAYWYGKKGRNLLREVLEASPDRADAAFGLGMFNYYSDQLPKIVKPLSFLLGASGDRELGIQQLELARKNGHYTKIEATFFLWDVYHQYEKQYDPAGLYAEELLSQYPTNPVFMEALCNSLIEGRKYADAISKYNAMLLNKDVCYANPKHHADVYFSIAYAYYRSGDYANASDHYRRTEQRYDASGQVNKSNLYYWMGLCEEKAGHKHAALTCFQKVLEYDDTFKVHSLTRRRIDNLKKSGGME